MAGPSEFYGSGFQRLLGEGLQHEVRRGDVRAVGVGVAHGRAVQPGADGRIDAVGRVLDGDGSPRAHPELAAGFEVKVGGRLGPQLVVPLADHGREAAGDPGADQPGLDPVAGELDATATARPRALASANQAVTPGSGASRRPCSPPRTPPARPVPHGGEGRLARAYKTSTASKSPWSVPTAVDQSSRVNEQPERANTSEPGSGAPIPSRPEPLTCGGRV
jgi:hypothetical protein